MWTTAKAPSLAEMEAMAHEIFARLPDTFRALCEGLIIRVDDFPTDEVLDDMQAESEFDLLGLFHGIGLPQQSHGRVARRLQTIGPVKVSDAEQALEQVRNAFLKAVAARRPAGGDA